MDQNNENDLFPEVMEANHLTYETINNELFIRKSKKKNNVIQTYIVLSVIGLTAGIFLFLFVWIKLGIIAIVLAGTFLFTAMNLRDREKNAEKKAIKISTSQIEIKEGYRTKKINLDDIAEFRTKVHKAKNLFVGNIIIVTDDNKTFGLLDIFGNDEEVVQNDLLIISNHLVDNYLP
ncbi:MAG: hypothetical protein H6571_09105 [Lewinellaceae bacterium]|nr:hypothetical protein [Lewinellaceae bacterium]